MGTTGFEIAGVQPTLLWYKVWVSKCLVKEGLTDKGSSEHCMLAMKFIPIIVHVKLLIITHEDPLLHLWSLKTLGETVIMKDS